MEAEASAIAFKISSDLRILRFASYLMVAGWGFMLVFQLLMMVRLLLAGSPIPLADIAIIIAFSILLSVALYSFTPRYRRAYLWDRKKWYQKSDAERFRTGCLRVLGGLALGILSIFALVFLEMVRSPGQDLGTYFWEAGRGDAPFAVLIAAIILFVWIVWTSRKAERKAETGHR
jgi:hypothetical protein